jgi:hypothetical protein
VIHVAGQILTETSATVDAEREADLLAGFQEILAGPLPDGLLRTELMRCREGRWRIQTLWRDRESIESMRASPEGPAAPRLFRSVGVEPSLEMCEVEIGHLAASAARQQS